MFKTIKITEVYGIPVFFHWTLYVVGPLYLLSSFPTNVLPAAFAVAILGILSIVLHEIGHCILALKHDCPVQSITMYPIGGVARLTKTPDEPRHEYQVAIAGPLVTLALAIIFGALAYCSALLHIKFLFIVTAYLTGLNIIWFLFNLIPAFPMDGGRLLRAWLTPRKGLLEATRIASTIGKYLALLGGIYALINGLMMSVIIAVFIYYAATAEYRGMLVRQQMQGFGGLFEEEVGNPNAGIEPDIEVGPAPYESKAKPAALKSMFITDTWTAVRTLGRAVRAAEFSSRAPNF